MDSRSQYKLPFISIVVLSYNQEDFIEDCIDSVLTQQYMGPLEIIFCDDCSTDETYNIICDKIKKCHSPYPIITHQRAQNGRVAVCMNTAIALSKGDWIMRVDGDDILHPDRVRLTASALLQYPNAVAVSGQLSEFSDRPHFAENPPDHELQYLVADKTQFDCFNKPKGLQWWGGVMTMSRRIFTEFGDLPAVCNVLDDTMFATRALMLGQFIIIRNGIFLYYRRHAGNISSATDKSEKQSIFQLMRADKAAREYHRRGIPCHAPILQELQNYTQLHPEAQGLLDYFQNHFANLQRHALYWEKSWKERIQDAALQGPFLRRLPHILSTFSRFTYALSKWVKQHIF